jgi:hypothetical protein
MEKAKDKWLDLIDKSFLSADFKVGYKELIAERFLRLNLL